MPKKFIKKIMPDHTRVREHPHLQMFGKWLHDPGIWHLNRRSASGAFAVGLFMAFVPLPIQMLLAAMAAILLRVNLPLSVALVWITNPLTIPPMFYFAYKVGALLLGTPEHEFAPQLNLDWLLNETGAIWEPLLLGCTVTGAVSALIGYSAIRLLWRMRIVKHYRLRKQARLSRHQKP